MAMNMEKLFEGLSEEEKFILKGQIERYDSLKGKERKMINIDNGVQLPKGTLIHGTYCNKERLTRIAKTGILTGQAIGVDEDGETYYCADFFRVSSDDTLENFNSNFLFRDGRCPFGTLGKRQVAFLIYPNKDLESLAVYDCYRENSKESDITKRFVNIDGLFADKEKFSAVLFGIPSNFINGIVLGDYFLDEEMVDYLIKEFPGAFITRNNGQIIYKNGDTLDIIKLRIQVIQKTILTENQEREIKRKNIELEARKKTNISLWRAISHLPIEEIIQVFEMLGYQGDFFKFAEQLKENFSVESEGKRR